jgi:hypothetical protein
MEARSRGYLTELSKPGSFGRGIGKLTVGEVLAVRADVLAPRTPQTIFTRSAVEVVVETVAVEHIVIGAAVDPVFLHLAVEVIAAGAASQLVASVPAVDAHRVRIVRGAPIVTGTSEEAVTAVASVQVVDAGTAAYPVTAVAAVDHIPAGTRADQIACAESDQPVVSPASDDDVLAVGPADPIVSIGSNLGRANPEAGGSPGAAVGGGARGAR